MSRAWLPRRFSVAIQRAVAAMAIVAATSFVGATAFAQDPRAVTTIGTDANIRRCSEAVVAGDTSDRTVEECTRALNYRRIDRPTQLQLLINRGVTHMRRGENEPAIADFDEEASQHP